MWLHANIVHWNCPLSGMGIATASCTVTISLLVPISECTVMKLRSHGALQLQIFAVHMPKTVQRVARDGGRTVLCIVCTVSLVQAAVQMLMLQLLCF